jgi:hypothetical protein
MADCIAWDENRWGLSKSQFLKGIEEAQANVRWFIKNLPELREEYQDCWVAIQNQSVIDSDDDAHVLIDRLRKKGVDVGVIEVRYVSEPGLIDVL